MPAEEVVGVLRRVDWAKGFVVIQSHDMRSRTIPFDLNPRTPDYRSLIGVDVKCVVEDGMVKSLDTLR